MPKPTLCMIFESIGTDSAIAKVAMTDVRIALEAGCNVTAVAKHLDESLRGRVSWLNLTVPPRIFLLKWLTARSMIKRALGDRQFDIIHAHQPQAASLSDVFQCHYLTRAAYELNCLESRPGLRPTLIRWQEHAVLRAEDHFYKNWNPSTRMLFVSHLVRDQFTRLYGQPPISDILVNPFPPIQFSTDEQRQAARHRLVGPDHKGPVVGYLGGLQERKGYQRLIHALKNEKDIFLLFAGSYSENFAVPEMAGRFRSLGLVRNTEEFYAACDCLLVPSLYEPLGLVAFEAASRGTPVIGTSAVGALPYMLEHGAAAQWDPEHEALGPIIRSVASRRAPFQSAAERLAKAAGYDHYKHQLLGVYDQVLREKSRTFASRAPAAKAATAAPSLCMVFESIDHTSAIAKIAMVDVQIALKAGYRVTVVSKRLDPSLQSEVEWLKLSVPPRFFALKWLTARSLIKRAMGERKFDIVHAHQPQAASMADVFQCHFLTRVAYERQCLEERTNARARLVRLQQQAVLYAEDHFYRHWNPATHMVFCSELLRSEFWRLYGLPPKQDVVSYAMPPLNFASDQERKAARRKILGDAYSGLVLGYLGGIQERKGYKLLLDALADQQDVMLLLAGQHTAEFQPPANFHGPIKQIGLVTDTDTFYAACDVLAVPSYFDPCPMVVFEASARGTPVLASDGCGNLPTLLQYQAGRAWDPNSLQSLVPLVKEMVAGRDGLREGIRRMNEQLRVENYSARMLGIYSGILEKRQPWSFSGVASLASSSSPSSSVAPAAV